jgi:hypothetical protein
MVSASLLQPFSNPPYGKFSLEHMSGMVQKHEDSRWQCMYHVRLVRFYRLIKSSIELPDEDGATLLIPFFSIDGR